MRSAPELLAELGARCDFSGLGAPVVVACSGGPDSLAMLALAAHAGLAPVAMHVEHGLRADSDGDATIVGRAARELGAPWCSVRVDVGPGPNLEARAREARYEALDKARTETGAGWVLVAHTADDQAETVVLNLLRGAASRGLAGMRARRDAIARPMLGLRRSDARALVDALGLETVTDPMNEDPAFLRVAVRQRVLPMFAEISRRDPVPVLVRQAELLGAESDFLDDIARRAWPGSEASARALAELDPVVAARAVRIWLGPRGCSAAEVARVLQVASGERRAAQITGGRVVRRSGGSLSLTRE